MTVSDEQKRWILSMDVESKQGTYQAIFTPFIKGMLERLLEFCVWSRIGAQMEVYVIQLPTAAPREYPIAPGVGQSPKDVATALQYIPEQPRVHVTMRVCVLVANAPGLQQTTGGISYSTTLMREHGVKSGHVHVTMRRQRPRC